MRVVVCEPEERRWQAFVQARPEATLYHRLEWATALRRGAGHQPFFLMAEHEQEAVGVLPLALVEGRLFGRFLVSLPHYCGGVCAASEEAAEALIEGACALARDLSVQYLELRGNGVFAAAEARGFAAREFKASFLLDLAPGEEALWRALRKQTRNRVRKGAQLHLAVQHGPHLVGPFWQVFSENMRALGSPTFAPRFFAAVLEAFGDDADVLLATSAQGPVAAKLVVRSRETLTLLWGASTAAGRAEGANYFLTWEAIRYALARGCRMLDMGRSTIGSGPYHFKANWGGSEIRHHWYIYAPRGEVREPRVESPRFRLARRVWRHLPLAITRRVGPVIAEQIP